MIQIQLLLCWLILNQDISITGPDSICIDGNSQLSPSSGGSWASLSPEIASITNGGLVTALSSGNAYFRFTESLTGCQSDSSQLIRISDKPLAILTGPDDICIGNTTSLFPTSGGTWISSNNAIATITNSGVVTGLTAGPVTFTYVQNVSLCQSLPSTPINVIARPDIHVDGDTILCIGETSSLTPSFGGSWTSLDPSIAAIDNAGIITGHLAGTTSFYFIDAISGCISDTSILFSINDLPTVSITGVDSICIADHTSLNPTSGGQWVSSDPAVATVDASGTVTGISAGNVAFIFIDDVNHCSSEPTDSITIKGKEIVLIDGDSSICIGSETYLIPNNGGSWQSTNPLVATVNNNGLVSAITEGSVSFIFTDSGTGCSSDTSDAVIVNGKPVISLAGPNMYCEGDTTQLLPSTGGSWTSSNVSIATISSSGNALGINGGLVKFIFTDAATGCDSDSSEWVEIIDRPNISISGSDALCVGANAYLLPTTGGSWQSTNPAVATIDNTGTVNGIMAGSSTFIFTESIHGCSSFPSDSIDFLVKPLVSVIGSSVICENDSTHLNPSSGGTWSSSDIDIATVDNNGLVMGKAGGSAQFIFTLSGSSCSSDPTSVVDINANPDITLSGSGILCFGQTDQMTPSTGGTWTSSNPAVGSIDNSGLIQTTGLGSFKVIFTSSTTGCKSDSSQLITIFSVPVVSITGNDTLCQGATSSVSPTTGGVWTSGNNAVATVQNNGQITAISDGSVSFTYTSDASGCASLPTALVRVYNRPTVSISGALQYVKMLPFKCSLQ
ncbi:MAG: Ig-like domain-containing protein [Saprospiraceae bacterium]|nr:Ig-like domain-containing protein [Saprospiraceae bacterium]